MKDTLKTLTCAAALLLAALPAVAVSLPQLPDLQDANGITQTTPAQNSEFLGNSGKCLVEASTPTLQGIVCVAGGLSGIVYGVDNSSGAAADVAIALDTGTAPAATVVGFDTRGLRISPGVLSAGGSATGCTVPNTCESWAPVRPRRFTNGLTLVRKGTSNAAVYYRLDSDNAALPVTK